MIEISVLQAFGYGFLVFMVGAIVGVMTIALMVANGEDDHGRGRRP
jgi:Na+(H+)/acetate symporter ActP